VEFDSLRAILGKRSGLVTEAEIAQLFDVCEFGAVPPVGAAYGLPVHVDGCDAFWGLAKDARRARFPGSPTSTESTGRDLYTATPWG
jgi:Ala-tRNA(Pro) deacylase